MGTASQLLASKLLRHFNMKPLILLGLVAFVRAQYSGETQDLSNSQLDALKDIFGDAAGGGAYSGQQVGRLEGGTNGVEAIIQVVKNEEGYVAPDDYQTTAGLVDKATTNVDNVFENYADYTESQGYECVPYYQCHNGTIITDGGGLIDIRNGFGILSPEDSKCPGFLDVCCLDPDFIPPPPPPIVKHVPKGLKAQETLNKYSQCNVFWQPIDAAPLTTGGNGYVDGGDVDISNFERDNYPAAPLTDGTDGYSEPKTVDSAPLTDGSYSEPKTAPQTEGSYDDAPPVKLTQGAYTEDTADLTGEVKAPGPVY